MILEVDDVVVSQDADRAAVAGEAPALALAVKRKAVRAEMILRSSFVVMTLWSVLAAALFSAAQR